MTKKKVQYCPTGQQSGIQTAVPLRSFLHSFYSCCKRNKSINMSQRCLDEGYSMINIQAVVQKSKLQDKKRGQGMPSLTHFSLKQKQASKVKVRSHSTPCSAPPKNIPIVMTHSLFSIPTTPTSPPLPFPLPPTIPAAITSGWWTPTGACPKGFLVQRHSALSSLPTFDHLPPPNQTLPSSTQPQRFHRGSP